MARYCGASLWSDGDRRCSSKWQETETETPVPVKRRGFKSCWRGIEGGKKKKKKIQGFPPEKKYTLPLFFLFPLAPPHSTSPLPFAPMLARLGTNRKQFDFRARRSGQRETWRERGGCWRSPSGKRNLYTSLLTNSSAPDALLHVSLLPIDFRQRRRILPPLPLRRLFDYRSCHTSCKHRNFLIFVPPVIRTRNESPFLFSYFLPFSFFRLYLRYSERRGWLVEAAFFPNELPSPRRRILLAWEILERIVKASRASISIPLE